MCAGGFILDKNDTYEVQFSLLDQSGNESIKTKSISFTSPIKETSDE